MFECDILFLTSVLLIGVRTTTSSKSYMFAHFQHFLWLRPLLQNPLHGSTTLLFHLPNVRKYTLYYFKNYFCWSCLFSLPIFDVRDFFSTHHCFQWLCWLYHVLRNKQFLIFFKSNRNRCYKIYWPVIFFIESLKYIKFVYNIPKYFWVHSCSFALVQDVIFLCKRNMKQNRLVTHCLALLRFTCSRRAKLGLAFPLHCWSFVLSDVLIT